MGRRRSVVCAFRRHCRGCDRSDAARRQLRTNARGGAGEKTEGRARGRQQSADQLRLDRQKQRHCAVAHRSRDGINGCRFGEQETGARIRDRHARVFCCAGRRSCGIACAICFAAIQWDAETYFSRRSEFGSARTTGRGNKSAGGAAINATRCIRFSCCFTEIVRRGAGRIALSNFIRHAAWKSVASSRSNPRTIVNMSILPNE